MAFRQQGNSTATTPVSKMMRGLGEVSLQGKTPGSAGKNRALFSKTPTNGGLKRAPLNRRDITPSRAANNVSCAMKYGGDRMIPSRSASQQELASFLMSQSIPNQSLNTSKSAPCSPSKEELDRIKFMKMMRTKSSTEMCDAEDEDRILVFRKNNAPLPPVGHMNAKVLYTTCVQPSSTVKKASRQIPSSAERILDAPNIIDDFYTELIDWESNNVLAAVLGYEVYLWNPDTGEIGLLAEANENTDLITAVKWAADGRFLAVGGDTGRVKLYDPTKNKELRKLDAERVSRATCMVWKDHILSIGYKSGQVISHDVRIKNSVVGVLDGHSQPVCGIHWSVDGSQLATGGGDNLVNIWDAQLLNTRDQDDPHVRLWDSQTGTLTKTLKVGSQVTAIRFNKDYNEMVVGLGRTSNAIKIFKHPSYTEIANIAGHTDRILGLSMSPCGQYVISASADESLRLWHFFKVDKSTQLLQHKRSKFSTLDALR
ncbi:unnamed protein product, partial [Mesorhabditis belari]|uniref:Anaphase-promoting complex subunit 4-like WD40 domain-containing protein n=1 Tax=Mesorhabditis belari TaxID=2138241 RepID=A0AAF3EF84_9BILA